MTESSTPRTDYAAVAASLRACTDPHKWHAADVIDELCRSISEDNAFHDALQELAVAQGKDPEQWDPIGVVDDALAQQDYAAAIAQALDLVLPMARGYAAEHPVGNNATMIEQAEAALDSTPRGAVAASAAEAYAVTLQSAARAVYDAECSIASLEEQDPASKERLGNDNYSIDLEEAREAKARALDALADVLAQSRHEIGQCDHEWVSADNPVVSGAVMCKKCRRIEAAKVPGGNEPKYPTPQTSDAVVHEATCPFCHSNFPLPVLAVGLDFEEWLTATKRDRYDPCMKAAMREAWKAAKSSLSQDTGFAQGWRAAIAAAATWVDRKGWEGTANALADDLCEPSQEGHATCNPQEADRG